MVLFYGAVYGLLWHETVGRVLGFWVSYIRIGSARSRRWKLDVLARVRGNTMRCALCEMCAVACMFQQLFACLLLSSIASLTLGAATRWIRLLMVSMLSLPKLWTVSFATDGLKDANLRFAKSKINLIGKASVHLGTTYLKKTSLFATAVSWYMEFGRNWCCSTTVV